MAEWNGLGRYPEDADVNDRPEEGTLLAYVDGSYQDALKKIRFRLYFYSSRRTYLYRIR